MIYFVSSYKSPYKGVCSNGLDVFKEKEEAVKFVNDAVTDMMLHYPERLEEWCKRSGDCMIYGSMIFGSTAFYFPEGEKLNCKREDREYDFKYGKSTNVLLTLCFDKRPVFLLEWDIVETTLENVLKVAGDENFTHVSDNTFEAFGDLCSVSETDPWWPTLISEFADIFDYRYKEGGENYVDCNERK